MQHFWIKTTEAMENFGMFYMLGGSHIHEGLHIEWLWEGRYEPKVTALG